MWCYTLLLRVSLTRCVEMKTLWKRSSSTRTSRAIRHGTLSRAFSTDAEHLASCDVQDCSWSTISAVKDEKGRGAEGETEEGGARAEMIDLSDSE
eukprot:g28732.t1